MELGIRPEEIEIAQGGTTVLHANVEMLSNVGSEKYIYARLGQEGPTVRAPKDAAFEPGQVIRLTVDPHRVHIFHEGRAFSLLPAEPRRVRRPFRTRNSSCLWD